MRRLPRPTALVLLLGPVPVPCGAPGNGGRDAGGTAAASVADSVRAQVTPEALARSLDSIVQYDRRGGG